MRRPSFAALFVAPTAATVLTFSGCAAPAPKTIDELKVGEATPAAPPAPAAAEAVRFAEQAAAAMRAKEGPVGPPEVRWLEPGAEVPRAGVPGVKPAVVEAASTQAVVEEKVEPAKTQALQEVASTQAGVEVQVGEAAKPQAFPGAVGREELVGELMGRIVAGDGAALQKALDAATLSVLTPGGKVDEALLSSLGYEQRDLVERYHQVLTLLTKDLASGEAYLDRPALDAKLDQLFGHDPVKIRNVQLCKRVMGYGVYEPFADHTFLAGRENKAIVYVELDQFQPSETGESQYEVKLQQELALFNEADGLAVWRNDPVQIVDNSRNRRRDFFVVQLVTLPARLSVGKYRLKVRVSDLHGGAIDETTVPLEVVADEKLVKSER